MNTRGILFPLVLVLGAGAYWAAQGCSESPSEPEKAQTVAEVTEPVTPPAPEAPPEGYEGPVRGIFLDGTLLSAEFEPTDVLFERARLDFNIGEEQWPDAGIRLAWLKRDQYKVMFNEKFSASPPTVPPKERFEIWLRYKIADTRAPKQKKLENYTLSVELEPDRGEGGLFGKIDLVCEDPKIVLRGTFEAQFKGERTQYGIANIHAGSDATVKHLVHEKFAEQNPDLDFRITSVQPLRRHKTMNKNMRLGYGEVAMQIGKELSCRGVLMVLTHDGWEVVEVLEEWQIPEAFPVLEPQAPPNGNVRSYIDYLVATWVQDTIKPDQKVVMWKNELFFGGQPLAWCRAHVTYRESATKKAGIERDVILRKTELGWMVEGEVLEGQKFDSATGEVVPMTKEEMMQKAAGNQKNAGGKQGAGNQKGAAQKGQKGAAQKGAQNGKKQQANQKKGGR